MCTTCVKNGEMCLPCANRADANQFIHPFHSAGDGGDDLFLVDVRTVTPESAATPTNPAPSKLNHTSASLYYNDILDSPHRVMGGCDRLAWVCQLVRSRSCRVHVKIVVVEVHEISHVRMVARSTVLSIGGGLRKGHKGEHNANRARLLC